jgi:hypothetical protein
MDRMSRPFDELSGDCFWCGLTLGSDIVVIVRVIKSRKLMGFHAECAREILAELETVPILKL